MIYLLDTSTVSDMIRESPRLQAHLAGLSRTDRIVICTIIRGEILFGIQRLPAGRKRRDLEEKAEAIFATIPCEAIPPEAAEHYAKVKISRQRQGVALDVNDLWIAATARALSATRVSRNRDFLGIDGLPVKDWME